MEAFARALRALPSTICDNAGLDSADIVATLRAAHGRDPESTHMGVDVIKGSAGDMHELGIYESFRVKNQVRVWVYLWVFLGGGGEIRVHTHYTCTCTQNTTGRSQQSEPHLRIGRGFSAGAAVRPLHAWCATAKYMSYLCVE